MNEVSIDSRLTIRVLEAWKNLADGAPPRRSQIDSKRFEPDWSNCFMVDLDPELSHSRFSHVGTSLQNLFSVATERRQLSECRGGTLSMLMTPHMQQVVEKKMPTNSSGSVRLENQVILYRTVLLPLSETGDQIDGMLVAFNYREIAVQNELPAPEVAAPRRRQRLSVIQ